MNKTYLALMVLAAFAAACSERKAEPRPDYDGARSHSEDSHRSLDKEAQGH